MATTSFFPVGTWDVDMDNYRTMYDCMTQPGPQPRSDFTTGYAGHMPDVKFKFGYGTPGPDHKMQPRDTLRDGGDISDLRIPGLPRPTSESALARKRDVLGDTMASERPASQGALRRTSSWAGANETRHMNPRTITHYFPKRAPGRQSSRCMAAYIETSGPQAGDLMGTSRADLLRSTTQCSFGPHESKACSVNEQDPITMSGGHGTGYDACSGARTSLWPKVRKSDPGHWSTSFRSAYAPPTFHRPLAFEVQQNAIKA